MNKTITLSDQELKQQPLKRGAYRLHTRLNSSSTEQAIYAVPEQWSRDRKPVVLARISRTSLNLDSSLAVTKSTRYRVRVSVGEG